MTHEEKLLGWTKRSSDSEKEKQERAERMVRQAVNEHPAFDGASTSIFSKGSYANNTNVKADSDVDIAVECTNVCYWEEASDGVHPPVSPYEGVWNPAKLRAELNQALRAKFPGQVDDSGSIAFRVNANTARVDADVVPCFTYKYYFSSDSHRQGTRVFRADGSSLENYPQQQLDNGIAKNNRTGRRYKRAVRILKRTENALAEAGTLDALPSYFMECLVYNCPDSLLNGNTWSSIIRGILYHIWSDLQGPEPETGRWLEPNGIKYLFHSSQPWTREEGRDLTQAAWNYWKFS